MNPKDALTEEEVENFYYPKFKEPIFISNMKVEIEKFLNKFLEDDMKPSYQSEKMKQRTKVKKISQDVFESQILKDKEIK